jgi:hypothetical protein
MFVLFISLVALFCTKEGFCLNVTNNRNDVEHLKQLVQQLNASIQNNVVEIGRLKNESASLRATLTTGSKSKSHLLQISNIININMHC